MNAANNEAARLSLLTIQALFRVLADAKQFTYVGEDSTGPTAMKLRHDIDRATGHVRYDVLGESGTMTPDIVAWIEHQMVVGNGLSRCSH